MGRCECASFRIPRASWRGLAFGWGEIDHDCLTGWLDESLMCAEYLAGPRWTNRVSHRNPLVQHCIRSWYLLSIEKKSAYLDMEGEFTHSFGHSLPLFLCYI